MPRKANTPPCPSSDEDVYEYEYEDSDDNESEYKPEKSDESSSEESRDRGKKGKLNIENVGSWERGRRAERGNLSKSRRRLYALKRGRRAERGNLSKSRRRLYALRSRKEDQLWGCASGKESGDGGTSENEGLDADDGGSANGGDVGLRITAGVHEGSNADERGSLSEGGFRCSQDTISGTSRATAKKVAPKRVRNRFSCRLGCSGPVQYLQRHYTSQRHKLTESEARRLARQTTRDKPLKAKGGHYRKTCAVPDCGVITSRITEHMRKQHTNLSKNEHEKYKYMARRIQEAPPETFMLTPVIRPRGRSLSLSPVDKRSVADTAISKIKRLDDMVKSFCKWQTSHSGGGRSEDMAQRTALEVQSYFDRFHPFSMEKMNERNFSTFVKEMRGTKKASSVLFYVRGWLKFLQFLLVRRYITDPRHTHLRTILVNIQNSLQREKKQQDVEADQDAYHGRLPPEIRHAYFQSDYVTNIRRVLMGELCTNDFVPVRNYLLTAITLWNGHRPGVLRNLTFADVNRGEIEVVDDEGPATDRTYMCITVSKHKTVNTWGAAILSLPPMLWRELRKYMRLAESMFSLEECSPVFLTVSGTGFERSSGLNGCLQDSYSRSGTQQTYPQRFNATAMRRLITTECRNVDPSSAPVIAAQLCHSVAMADRTYALKRKTQLSSKAVHMAEKSIAIRSKEQKNLRRAVDWEEPGPSDKGRVLRDVNDLDTDDWGEDIEKGSREGEIEGWKEQTKEGSQVGRIEGLGEGFVTFQDLPEDRGEFGTILGNLLQDLDWDQILQDAQFWTEDLSVYQLGQNTSVLAIADCLHDVLHERFAIDLFEILQTEMPRADDEDNPGLLFVMAALAACRLGVLFGSSLDPDTMPSSGEGRIDGRKEQTKEGSQVEGSEGLGAAVVTFQDLPEDRGEFGTILGNLLQDLDWDQILQDAQFWTEDLSVYLLGQNTSVLAIADCLHDALHERFTIDLFQIIKTEMPKADDEDNPDLHFVMAALAACRLGVLFGSSVDPDTIPTPGLYQLPDLFLQGDLENREESREERKKLTLVPGESEEIAQEERHDREIRKDIERRTEKEQERRAKRVKVIRERGLGSVVAERARKEEGVEGDGNFFKGRKFGENIDRKLREVYRADLKISIASGRKTLLAAVRRRIDEVHTYFPDLSAQQIRDKLWTIAAKERRALKGLGKGKGKGKRSKE